MITKIIANDKPTIHVKKCPFYNKLKLSQIHFPNFTKPIYSIVNTLLLMKDVYPLIAYFIVVQLLLVKTLLPRIRSVCDSLCAKG